MVKGLNISSIYGSKVQPTSGSNVRASRGLSAFTSSFKTWHAPFNPTGSPILLASEHARVRSFCGHGRHGTPFFQSRSPDFQGDGLGCEPPAPALADGGASEARCLRHAASCGARGPRTPGPTSVPSVGRLGVWAEALWSTRLFVGTIWVGFSWST